MNIRIVSSCKRKSSHCVLQEYIHHSILHIIRKAALKFWKQHQGPKATYTNLITLLRDAELYIVADFVQKLGETN